jgi:hypothetical protein
MKSPLFHFQLLLLTVSFYACRSVSSASFSKDLHRDTVMYVAYIDARQPLSQTYTYMGPYFIQFGESLNDTRRKKTLTSTNAETSDAFKFTICQDSVCVNAETSMYMKTKTTSLSPLSLETNEPSTKVKDEKLSGLIYIGIEPAKNFQVNILGKKRGHGFFRLSETEIVSIRPIQKNTSYGSQTYAVGLEFTLDNKVVGSFIQANGLLRIAMKNSFNEKQKLLLTALCLSLMNKTNEIIVG